MKKTIRIFKIFLFLFTVTGFISQAQLIEPAKWSYEVETTSDSTATLIFKAKIINGWAMYSSYFEGDDGPIKLDFTFEPSDNYSLIGKIIEVTPPKTKFDEIFKMDVGYFEKKATVHQEIKILSKQNFLINGEIEGQGCDDESCVPISYEFSISINEKDAKDENTETSVVSSSSIDGSPTSSSGQPLWIFILIAASAGLLAILTPCVFPIIPMTVSFFMRSSKNRAQGIKSAIFFGVSITLIFTLFGALFSLGMLGANAANIMSTHWLPNIIFFLLFLIFAISFFGAFEIVLPSSLVNKTDAQVEKGGLLGAFFMALTTVIVSFSCIGPFIGTLIIEAVQDGGYRPMIGMFSFGLAFAIPFTFLAIFPSTLNKLPKSGGWLNAIKVVFAFILLAFGFKFLSNIDQVYGLGILGREIYLAIWIVIFTLMGFYLLGKIKLPHDSDLNHIGIVRFFLSIVTFIFSIYLFTGLFGAPLKTVSSLLPPQSSHNYFASSASKGVGEVKAELCGSAKYADRLHLPHGLSGYFDLDQGLACAKEKNKPAFIVFKGHACANCKKMENTVWTNPEALKLLSEKFVIIALYTDDRATLPEDEWVTSANNGKVIKKMGKKNLDFQISKYNTNSIPFHVIKKPDGSELTLETTFKEEEFLGFIKKGL